MSSTSSWKDRANNASFNLICPVEDLCAAFESHVNTESWLDAALTAAAVWQATDDALGATASPLTLVAGRIRRKIDRDEGRLSRVLDAALRAVSAPSELTPAARRQVDRWRQVVQALAVETAVLATQASDIDAGRRAGHVAHLLSTLGEPPPRVRGAVTRIPSSFRSFDQHPDDVSTLIDKVAARLPDRSRPVVVVGVRTSGSYLAPLAVAFLRRAGFSDVSLVSARPDQWYLRGDVRILRTAAAKRASALVIDDPPNTGKDVARVCRELGRFGFPASSTIPVLALFDENGDPPEPLSPFDAITIGWPEWSIHRRLGPERAARRLSAAFFPATVRLECELPAPEGLPRAHARRLYRVQVTDLGGSARSRTVLAVGSGMGYFGNHDVAVASALKHHVPEVLDHDDGVLYLDWPSEAKPLRPAPDVVVDYVCARHDNLAVADDPSVRLRGSQPVWEVASHHLSRVWGKYWPIAHLAFVSRLTRELLRTTCPSVTDGDMRVGTWIVGSDTGRPVKTSFSERSFSNFDLVSFDDRFDVVGAAVHSGDPDYARNVRAAYEERTEQGISPERWLLYELVHLWDMERLGGATPETTSTRKAQALRRYLAQVLLPDVTASNDGPIVALDVDGVLETDGLGFRAPTPTSLLCLRALHAHGLRTVLATGRCLDDVVEMCDLFGLAGGAAEYGSVVYDRRAGSVDPLVTTAELAVLTRLRDRLRPEPAVRIDDRHQFSVRASAVDGRHEPRTYRLPPSAVPDGVRAVFGEEQTDFVSDRVDKLEGVRALVRQLGAQTPVLAVGDTASDARLLEWALVSVVPRHADAQAKAAARLVAPRPYQLGLADAIGTLIGHRPGECPRCAPPVMSADTQTMLRLLRIPEGSRVQALLRSVPLLRSAARSDARSRKD
jgi:hydroxymethylpyrimidine pyrophosphatase-like HAD family hydrolase